MFVVGSGVATNYDEVIMWYQKAAKQGYAPAQ
jgi:TPR repeat protein